MVTPVDGALLSSPGRRLPRLLRGALIAAALAAAGWLLAALFATTASADPTQPTTPGETGSPGSTAAPAAEEPTATAAPAAAPAEEPAAEPTDKPMEPTSGSGGLLGGLLGGVTNTVGGVVDAAVTTVGQVTGTVLNTASSVLAPVIAPPQEHPIITLPVAPAPAPDRAAATPRTAQPIDAPAEQPAPVAPVAPAASAEASAPAAPRRAVEVPDRLAAAGHGSADSSSGDSASRSRQDPLPTKAPAAPVAPVAPGSSVSTAHDNSGNARGMHGVLADRAGLELPTAALASGSHAANAAGRVAGLPPTSPD